MKFVTKGLYYEIVPKKETISYAFINLMGKI